MDSYKEIEKKLARLEPFHGNSMRGEFDERGNFRVFSYATEIATYWALLDGKSLETSWFSETTSKHQRLIAKVWGFEPLKPKKERLSA